MKAFAEFGKHYGIQFSDPALLKLALTHRSYLSVTGQGPRESNERLEFLGDSVLGLVTSEFLYRQNPNEHEGQLTKAKSLLVSKAILSRRALAMGLGRFVLMSHAEVESGGRQRLSILADAFESVVGAIYLDQGFEAARHFIERWLLRDAREIASDKRHTNYKSHLQEYVQSTFRTHPAYRIRSEMGPDHSKHFIVEVMVGRRVLGEGKGRNKKEAEQAAARDALDRVGDRSGERSADVRREPEERRAAEERRSTSTADERRGGRESQAAIAEPAPRVADRESEAEGGRDGESGGRRRRGRRGGRGRRERSADAAPAAAVTPSLAAPTRATSAAARAGAVESSPFALPPEDGRFERLRREAELAAANDIEVVEVEPLPSDHDDDDFDEVGRPEGPLDERHVDVYAVTPPVQAPVHEPVYEPVREPIVEPAWASDEGAEAEVEPEPAAEDAWAPTLESDTEEEGDDIVGPEPPATAPRSAPPAATPPQFGRRSRRGR